MTPRPPIQSTPQQVTTREVSACHPPTDWFPHMVRTPALYHRRAFADRCRSNGELAVPPLLFVIPGAGVGGLLWRIRGNVNNFSAPSVVELLARFLLDGSRVGFERSDLLDVLTVFVPQAPDFTVQRLHLGALLPINHHAVGSEHGVQQYYDDKKDGGHGSQPTPLQRQPRPDWARAFDPTSRRSLRLWRLVPGLRKDGLRKDRAKAFLPPWKKAHSRRWS